MPQFNPSTFSSQIFWLILCFLFLVFFMYRRGVPRVRHVLDKRAHHIHAMKKKETSCLENIATLSKEMHTLKTDNIMKTNQTLDTLHQELIATKERALHEQHDRLAKARKDNLIRIDHEFTHLRTEMTPFAQKLAKNFLNTLSTH